MSKFKQIEEWFARRGFSPVSSKHVLATTAYTNRFEMHPNEDGSVGVRVYNPLMLYNTDLPLPFDLLTANDLYVTTEKELIDPSFIPDSCERFTLNGSNLKSLEGLQNMKKNHVTIRMCQDLSGSERFLCGARTLNVESARRNILGLTKIPSLMLLNGHTKPGASVGTGTPTFEGTPEAVRSLEACYIITKHLRESSIHGVVMAQRELIKADLDEFAGL